MPKKKAAAKKRAAPKRAPAKKRAAPRKAARRPIIQHAPAPPRPIVSHSLPEALAKSAPREESREKPRKNILPWLIAAGLGFLLISSKRGAAATLPPLPKPAAPLPPVPLQMPSSAAAPPPAAPPPAATAPPTSVIHPDSGGGASWSPDGKTLNSLPGYHRAKGSEVTSEIVAAAQGALSGHAIGQIVYGTTSSGVNYAIALEQHYHPPGGAEKPWGPHKGSSVFVQNAA